MKSFNFEKKYNFYKNSNLSNKNYKMNKYLNKLNIDGGTDSRKIPTPFRFNDANYLGSGVSASVYSLIDGSKEFAIKRFVNHKLYYEEKELFIKKLSIYCGNINILLLKYYKIDGSNVDLIESNYKKTYTQIKITGNILTYIKSIAHTSIQSITELNIKLYDNPLIMEVNITDESANPIGTMIKNGDIYDIYIDIPKNMKLLYYNDNALTLFYKNLGGSLSTFLRGHNTITYIQKIYLCIDLIRQVNDLINNGIHHNDLKNDNIVIKQIGNNYYLTIIDYGIALTNSDIKRDYDSANITFKRLGDHYYNTTANAYSPEYFLINKLIRNRYVEMGTKKSYDYIIGLFNKSLHWILGGICINILNSSNIQLRIWRENLDFDLDLYNTSSRNIVRIRNYARALLSEIPNFNGVGLNPTELQLYNNLCAYIRNLLEIDVSTKKLLSVDFGRLLNIEPYLSYYATRQVSEIDN